MTLEGDEWRSTPIDDEEPPTRAEMQAKINRDYAAGRLTRDQWERGTAHLSGCEANGTRQWDAQPYVVR